MGVRSDMQPLTATGWDDAPRVSKCALTRRCRQLRQRLTPGGRADGARAQRHTLTTSHGKPGETPGSGFYLADERRAAMYATTPR